MSASKKSKRGLTTKAVFCLVDAHHFVNRSTPVVDDKGKLVNLYEFGML